MRFPSSLSPQAISKVARVRMRVREVSPIVMMRVDVDSIHQKTVVGWKETNMMAKWKE